MIAIDTNIIAYAEQSDDPRGRHGAALALIERLSTGEHCIPVQVLAEFANACCKKRLLDLEKAALKIGLYQATFETPRTGAEDVIAAQTLLEKFNLQFFDALILTVARRAGATMLLSEDMHDGLEVGEIRVVNPFLVANAEVIAAALS